MANLSPKHFLALCSLLLALCHLQRFKWFRRSTNIAYRSPATILDLPLEIRLRVFAFVFAGKKLAVRSSSRTPATRYSLELEPQIYNVALTCRQFYEEIQQGGFEYCVWHFQSFGALNQLAKYPTKILHPRQLKRVVVTGFRGLDWQVLNQLPNLTVLVLNVERAREIYWDTPHVIYHYADDGVLRTVKEWFIKDWDLVTGGELDVAAQDVLRLYRMKQRKFSISLLFYVEGLPEINANVCCPICQFFWPDANSCR
jgi:hypothetical protein